MNKKKIRLNIKSHIELINKQIDYIEKNIFNFADVIINKINSGGKILIIGNGGSAADAQHFATELVGRFKTNRKALPAIALTTDTSSLTSISNDFGYEYVFTRQIEALAKKDDVVIGISTSGSSSNVLNAIKLASKLNLKSIGLSGKDGGEMNEACTINIAAPSEDTPRIQEIHIIIAKREHFCFSI